MRNLNGGHWYLPAIVSLVLLAALLRLYNLDITPPGLHYDEAFNALQARDVLTGANRPVFFVGDFGLEPMQVYAEAGIAALVGESPWTARLSSVLFGILLIPALYFASRAFFPEGRVVGLGAAAIGAILYWAINFSRLGLEVNSLPWILTLCAGSMVLANRKRSLSWSAVTGILLGLTLYTYLAARAFPFALVLWFIYLLVVNRQEANVRIWIVLGICALIVSTPLLLFFTANPLAFAGRVGQVVTLDQVGDNLIRTASMFFVSGDADPRDNLPGRPALDPLLSVLFLIGLVVSIARSRNSSFGLLLIWFGVMTLPSALTEFAPNFRRAIGALPAVAILCGVGLDWIWTRLGSYRVHTSTSSRIALVGVLALGFGISLWSSAQAYFVNWAGSPGLYYSFDAGLLQVARAMASRPDGEQLCLSPDYHDHPTVLWAIDGREFSSFDGRRVAVIPDSALPSTCAIITREDQTFSLPQFFPSAQPLSTIYDLERKPYAQILYVPAGVAPILKPQHLLNATIGQAIRCVGFDITTSSERIDLTVYWRSQAQVREDYTVFVHLLGLDAASETTVRSQDDAQPGHGSYPTSRWRTGETIVDHHSLTRPSDRAAAVAPIEIGMYLLDTGARQPVFIEGVRAPEDRIILSDLKR